MSKCNCCNCEADLGCFASKELIEFGVQAHCDGDYIFHVCQRGQVMKIAKTFVAGDQLVLEYAFDEIGEACIKIEVPQNVDCRAIPGFNYITTTTGACSFKVSGIVSPC
jgi:hypothetical protein|tara:strand:- start:2883 stop:3209 length:327 start_codon:yes stop_codon:yes gene_type:complete